MSEQKLTNDQLAQLRSYRDGLLEARGIAHSQPTAQGVPAASSPDHIPCAICEEAAKACRDVERRIAAVRQFAPSRSESAFVGEAAARDCAISIRAACTHATPPRSELADQLEALGKAATPGPWVVRRNDEVDGEIHYDLDSPENVEVACLRSGLPHDARLIVALVNALPEILTALRRTR